MKNFFSLYSVLLTLFTLLIVVPVLYTFGSAFFFNQSLSNDISAINVDSFILLAKSIFIAAFIAVLSSSIGTILAFILYKTKLKYRNIFHLALLIPLFISPYILSVAWKDFFFLVFDNTSFISSYFGVIIVLTTVYTPLSMLIVGSSLSNISSQIEDSALMIIKQKGVIIRIILPLIKPALISSFVLIFIFSISNFAVPAFFGVKVFTTEIFTQFSAFYKHSFAIIQSVLLILICIGLLVSEYKYISEAPFLSIGNRGTSTKIYNNQKSNLLYLVVIFWLIISIILPLFVLLIQSFANGSTHFAKAFELLLPTLTDSFILSLLASIIIVFISFIVAYTGARKKQNTSLFVWLALIIFTIPSTVYGISLIKFYNHSALNFIYASYAIIVIAYIGKFTFISTKIISNAIKQIPVSISESAIIMGISPSRVIYKILMPLIFPALFASFIISFIFTLGELGTTIMIYPPGTEIMPIKVFTIMANAPQSLTSSMNLIVFSLILVLISLFSLLAKSLSNKPYYVNNQT